MGIFQRLKLIFNAKANEALDRAEDPRQTLDYAYARQLELLQNVKRGVAEVATSRKRLELQLNKLEAQEATYAKQAVDAMRLNREDLAREALTRRAALDSQVTDLRQQHAALLAEEERLTASAQQLQQKVEAFRTKKETIKATYTAAEAQARIGEAFSGVSKELGDVGNAIQRAEDKTAQLQARAGALDELMAAGTLDDYTGNRDDIAAELQRVSASVDVELELEKIKAQLGQASAPAAAIDAGAAAPADSDVHVEGESK